jgi:hypothetical protein
MSGFWNLNLIHFVDFYFSFLFVVNTLRRLGQYHAVARLVLTTPGRWPRLFRLIKEHSTIFLTWSTLLPGLLALSLSVVQLLASRLVWPEAGRPPYGLTIEHLWQHWPALLAVLPLGCAMFGLDVYFLVRVGKLDRAEVEKYFDQAEYWLRSGTAHVVRIFTLGRINPRKMVAVEVQKALHELNSLLHNTFWWVTLQVGLRLVFGLSLWTTWAVTLHT